MKLLLLFWKPFCKRQLLHWENLEQKNEILTLFYPSDTPYLLDSIQLNRPYCSRVRSSGMFATNPRNYLKNVRWNRVKQTHTHTNTHTHTHTHTHTMQKLHTHPSNNKRLIWNSICSLTHFFAYRWREKSFRIFKKRYNKKKNIYKNDTAILVPWVKRSWNDIYGWRDI